MTRLIESGGTPYVEADSPQEAAKLLDQIERDPSGAAASSTRYGPWTLVEVGRHQEDRACPQVKGSRVVDLAHYCKGGESTGWAGATLGTIVYGHKTYYARAYSPEATLSCGG